MTPSNLLILCAGGHARRAAGCYGDPAARTPTLDILARLGTRFAAAYTPSPVPGPGRAALATGRPVHELAGDAYDGSTASWMHRLREAGHPVVAAGPTQFAAGGETAFDDVLAPEAAAAAADLLAALGPMETPASEADRRVAEAACRWLARYARRLKRKPWCLFVSLALPGQPYAAPPEFFDLHAGRALPLAPRRPAEHPVAEAMRAAQGIDDLFDDGLRLAAARAWYGQVSFVDRLLRQVLTALEDAGADRDTTILYTASHGDMLGGFGLWGAAGLHEDACGVPLILAGPEIGHGVAATPVTLADIAATAMVAVGLTLPKAGEPWQSRPLQAVASSPDPERFVVSEMLAGPTPCGQTMLRHGAWKLVHHTGGHPPQLFDLAADPGELRDLGESRRHERERDRLRTLLGHVVDPDAAWREARARRDRTAYGAGPPSRAM